MGVFSSVATKLLFLKAEK
ncbi:hypothetical protein OIU76_030277, partial [Salix suchowensis]